MKKNLISFIVFIILGINIAYARFFIGADMAYGIAHTITITDNNNIYGTKGFGKPNYKDYNFGLNLGTEHAFGMHDRF